MRPELMPANSVNLDLRQGPPETPATDLPIIEHLTPRKAIKEDCRECAGGALSARDCEMDDCPVFHFRPGAAPQRQMSAAELEMRRQVMARARAARQSAAEASRA